MRIAAEVKGFAGETAIDDRKLSKFASRAHRFALAAAQEAIRDAGIHPTEATAERWACAVGTGMMGVEFAELAELHRHCAADGELNAGCLLSDAVAADPIAFCRSQSTAGLALLLRRFGIRGYATSVHTACASGGQAIGTAMKVIRRGAADCALAGGFDSMISPVGLGGFCLLSALSADNETPERASRPFDATRNGFVLGEGAGFLVLEEWASARRRGARDLRRAGGRWQLAFELPDYRFASRRATGRSRPCNRHWLMPAPTTDEVDYLNAHGTSTLMNDRSESAAIRAVFGAHATTSRVSSTKSVMGHLIAAAGAVEVAVCALAIRDGMLPVNANLTELDPECALDIVRGEPRRRRVRVALSNSFGFGGSNSCVVLRNPSEVDGGKS